MTSAATSSGDADFLLHLSLGGGLSQARLSTLTVKQPGKATWNPQLLQQGAYKSDNGVGGFLRLVAMRGMAAIVNDIQLDVSR
ncbi:hypothetical protein EV681_1479 [Advenella incenata]|uniref:Uncharacterized protein n=1 Tax=Advenella incenata TaxID=267800 RepID=A0A4Q7VTN7_9BURK|nr:hypothetical protein EV681_1479 [Advenella incenata]